MDDAAPRAASSAPTTDETLVAAALRKSVADREPALHGPFQGPYAGGPPPEALNVETPSLHAFGIAELRRMVVIYITLLVSVIAALAVRVVSRRSRSWPAAAAEGAVNGFVRLGPTFVKLGQLIASSPGLFPLTLSNACQRCLDDVPPFDGATAREMIRNDLGLAPEQIFKHFDETPLSAASIGQVHACVLPDGREGVIKLQRPNCGPHMICMERMSGVPVDEFDELRERGIDGELVIRRGAKAWLEAVVEHGPFHGDMHAGNIWVLDDGRSSFLDFGIMGELPPQWRRVFKDLVMTISVDREWSRVARGYRELGILPDGLGTDEELGFSLKMLMEPMLDRTAGETSLGESLKASLDMSEQLGAAGSPKELVLVTKQLLYIERYIKGLAPDYVMLNDPFVIKNIFPEHAAKRAAELGVTFPE